MKNISKNKHFCVTLFIAAIIFSLPSYAKESKVYYGSSLEQFEYRFSDKSGESFNWGIGRTGPSCALQLQFQRQSRRR